MNLNKIVVMIGVLLSCQFAIAGSVSGGGGGTLPGEKVGAKDVIEAVAESRSVIEAFLKGVETSLVLDDGTRPQVWYRDYQKMFRPGTDIFKFLNEVPFLIISNGACHDLDGSETDASANTDIEGGICVSVSRIQPKVSFANYRAEIGALVLHEISHLYGSDETEAEAVQKIAVRFFVGTSPFEIGEWSYQIMDSLQSLNSMTQILRDSLKYGAKIPCDNVRNLAYAYMSALHDLAKGGKGMFLTRERDTEYYWQLSTKIMAMEDFLCTQDGYIDEFVRQIHIDKFNKIWGTDSELTADQYFKRRTDDRSTFNRFPLVSVKIKKYTSPSEWR